MPVNTDQLIVSRSASLREVLEVIDKNAMGAAFVVDQDQRLVGVLTDGDIRRALLKGKGLDTIAGTIINKTFVSRPADTPMEELISLLKTPINVIPLVDSDGRVVDFSCLSRVHRIPIMEPFLNGNELNYVIDCVKSKWISSQGKYVLRFEEMFCELLETGNAVAVSNGTVALHLALVSLGIGPGDEVIVPDLTFAASANAVLHAGAKPVLVDVCKEDWCLDPDAIEAVITSKTKAIMPVHLYGQPSQMDKIMSVATKHGLKVIEDCAESLGSRYRGKHTGTIGDAGCFSFFGNKMITTGEGGMVVFKRVEDAERARILRDHGMSKERRYWHIEVGYNYRMTNLQAAIGVAQLEQFDKIFEQKMLLAKTYSDLLANFSGVRLPPALPHTVNSHWLYTVLFEEKIFGPRSEILRKLASNGIEARPVFWPLHQMELYSSYSGGREFPVSDALSNQGLSLPSSAMLTGAEVSRICNALKNIVNFKQLSVSLS